jgi:hypothetical protein
MNAVISAVGSVERKRLRRDRRETYEQVKPLDIADSKEYREARIKA